MARSRGTQLFGEALKRAREAKSLTQVQLAGEARIPLSMIQMYEQGRSLPSAGRLATLCQTLGVTAESLIPQDWTAGRT